MSEVSNAQQVKSSSKRLAIGCLLILALLIVAGVGYQVWQRWHNNLKIEHIHLEGEWHNLEQATVKQQLAKYQGQNLMTLDGQIVRTDLLKRPWIGAVSVEKQWPDTLRITIYERKAEMMWNNRQMIDKEGKIFHPNKIRTVNYLPHIISRQSDHRPLFEFMQKAQNLLASIDLKPLTLERLNSGAWQLRLNNQTLLKLGVRDQEQRLRRFVLIYPQLTLQTNQSVQQADLRYPHGMAVQWNKS